MIDKFKQYIEEAERILITSHISPDPDAICSVLLLGTTLRLNFPDKKIEMALEEEPYGLDFLSDRDQIKFGPLAETVTQFAPDLFIMADVMNIDRCTRKDEAAIREHLKAHHAKLAIIDHHQKTNPEAAEISMISESIAASQDIYELCFNQLHFQKPQGYAQTALTGIYADSGGFVYRNPDYRRTFQIVGDLIEDGASLEVVNNKLNQYSEGQLEVIGELATNIAHQADYSYTFISDEFVADWLKLNKSMAELQAARKQFINDYIRNVEGRGWGFIVYRNPLEEEGVYSASLRAMAGLRDVSLIANKLEGGGHKPAAAGKVRADNVQQALDKVKAVIAQTD